MIEAKLISSIKQRKKAAFKTMYQACIGYVYAIVRRYVSNESDHPDVIQEIFARVFLSIDTFDESKGDFKFWLRRLVINQCLQHYRQGKSPRLMIPLEVAGDIKDDDDQYLQQLTKKEIEDLLSDMPTGYRQIFMLVIIDEYTHKEVGELLDISAETSRSQLSRAKNWLRKKFLKNNSRNTFANGI